MPFDFASPAALRSGALTRDVLRAGGAHKAAGIAPSQRGRTAPALSMTRQITDLSKTPDCHPECEGITWGPLGISRAKDLGLAPTCELL